MKDGPQKAKVVIEMEDGEKVTFVAVITFHPAQPFLACRRHSFRGDYLPEGPRFYFNGSTISGKMEMEATL